MATAERSYERVINPIDLVEQLATATTGRQTARAMTN